MKRKWTRRKFLATGLKGSMVVTGSAVAGLATAEERAPRKTAGPSGLDSRERATLGAALDDIIPAGDGMPAASEVGGAEYLEGLAHKDPTVRNDLAMSLTALDKLSRKEFGKEFRSLSQADRIEALKKLEKQPGSNAFATLRDLVYEAYYTQPRVWKLIGYEFYPTHQAGPRMKPFDESVLAQVKKMPKRYREVS